MSDRGDDWADGDDADERETIDLSESPADEGRAAEEGPASAEGDEREEPGETPADQLEEAISELADEDVDVDADADVDRDPFAELDVDAEDPFAELDADREADEAAGDPFERMEVEDLDEDVWEALAEGEPDLEIGGPATTVERGERGEREDHIVDKREYCQRCPHFTKPPAVDCENEGTDIVEVVDSEQFRVRGCPMIGEEGPSFDHET